MQDKPNILLILNDDMGFSDLGCYGGENSVPEFLGGLPVPQVLQPLDQFAFVNIHALRAQPGRRTT